MNQLQFFKGGFSIALLLNIILLAFIFFRPAKHSKSHHFLHEVVHELQLDESQKAQFLASAKTHHELIEANNTKQKALISAYFNFLTKANNHIPQDSLLQELSLLKEEKIQFTYQHFAELKQSLRVDQQKNFPKVLHKALGILLENKSRKKP
jgi:hypothetical protein